MPVLCGTGLWKLLSSRAVDYIIQQERNWPLVSRELGNVAGEVYGCIQSRFSAEEAKEENNFEVL